jgi:two-component system, response regulator YesN
MNMNYYNMFNDNIRLIENVPWCETIDEYSKWIQNTYYVVLKGLSDINNIKHNKLILKAAEYIKINYTQDITVQELANYIQKTPNYFSHLFKREFGTSFSDYVNKIRINEAKKLILGTNLLIYEITEKVGFKDYDYFKQVFKKLEGCSPSEFRKTGLAE